MPYFNYHAMVKKRISQSVNVQMAIVDAYNDISPCLVVITDSGNYPIREHRWQEYFELAEKRQIKIQNNMANSRNNA